MHASSVQQALYRNIRFALNEMFQKFFSCNFAFLAIMNAPPPFGHSPGHLFGKKVAQNEKRKKDTYTCANFEAHLS